MRPSTGLLRVTTALAALVPACLAAAALGAPGDTIENGVVWRDTQGNEMWANSGNMIREGDTFYWLGYDTRPGHPWRTSLYSSRDLVRWTFVKTLLEPKGELASTGWAGRPALLRNPTTGKYVIVFEASGRWPRHKVAFAVSDRIDGDYKLVGAEYPEPGLPTGDQSVYQEGTDAYLVTVVDSEELNADPKTVPQERRNRLVNVGLGIYKLTPDYLHIEKRVFRGFDRYQQKLRGGEAPHIIKVADTYYWFVSGLRGWRSSATQYATAQSLAGPWSEQKDVATTPASPDSFNTQHDFVIPIVGSEATTWLYVGDRFSQWHRNGTGRNIFLPLVWEDGKPVLKWVKSWRIDIPTGRWAAAETGDAPAPKN